MSVTVTPEAVRFPLCDPGDSFGCLDAAVALPADAHEITASSVYKSSKLIIAYK